jgi:hypothetical protein
VVELNPAQAYADSLARTRQSLEETLEGYGVWFDEAIPQGSGPALDFGAGAGDGVLYLASRGYDAGGFEPNPDLAEASEALEGGDPAAFLAGRPGRYTLILCKDVLEHLERDAALEITHLLFGALAPGGRLVVSVPHAVSFVGTYVRYADYTHRTAFTSGSLRYLLESGGGSAVRFFGPRFRFKLSAKTLAYRALKRGWHLALRGIYYLENPSADGQPPHFHPRLVASANSA